MIKRQTGKATICTENSGCCHTNYMEAPWMCMINSCYASLHDVIYWSMKIGPCIVFTTCNNNKWHNKLEFKAKNNKIIETIQTEKIIKNENNIIKFEDKKKKFNKTYVKKPKKKFYKKYKKKSK